MSDLGVLFFSFIVGCERFFFFFSSFMAPVVTCGSKLTHATSCRASNPWAIFLASSGDDAVTNRAVSWSASNAPRRSGSASVPVPSALAHAPVVKLRAVSPPVPSAPAAVVVVTVVAVVAVAPLSRRATWSAPPYAGRARLYLSTTVRGMNLGGGGGGGAT